MEQNFKPILFSTEMVQSILDGRKTQTRRVIKEKMSSDVMQYATENNKETFDFISRNAPIKFNDILWVRETFEYFATNWNPHDKLEKSSQVTFNYKASDRQFLNEVDVMGELAYKALYHIEKNLGFKPSIHMPKDAARIFLKVTDVRCERLNEISCSDCKAEGVFYEKHENEDVDDVLALEAFMKLWDRINGKTIPWESNPWVWVYTFEKIEKPINFK